MRVIELPSAPAPAARCMMANTLSWGKHDTQGHAIMEWDTVPEGYTEYVYHSYFVEWQTIGPIDPRLASLHAES
jgi:hypothetical protein